MGENRLAAQPESPFARGSGKETIEENFLQHGTRSDDPAIRTTHEKPCEQRAAPKTA
jgi:hypothetical protein